MVGKTATRNAEDNRRLAAIKQIGCIPCMIEGWNDVQCTIQHVTEGGRRKDDEHRHTYGSCEWHHLGFMDDTMKGDVKRATNVYGPSFARDKRGFAKKYGTESELVSIQDALIRMYKSEAKKMRFIPPAELGRLTQLLHQEIVVGVGPNPSNPALSSVRSRSLRQ